MPDWERLTGEKDARMLGTFYQKRPEHPLPHELALASQSVQSNSRKFSLSDPELDALATRSEAFAHLQNQVQALVEAVRPVYKTEWMHAVWAIVNLTDRKLAEELAGFMRVLHLAFDPFETPDAT